MGRWRLTLLLDTHALLWWLQADPRLSVSARQFIEDGAKTRYVSVVSAFEIATKIRIGKLEAHRSLAAQLGSVCRSAGFAILPLLLEHALLAGSIRAEHRDPFDRLLAAQSRIDGLMLLSSDPAFQTLGVETVW